MKFKEIYIIHLFFSFLFSVNVTFNVDMQEQYLTEYGIHLAGADTLTSSSFGMSLAPYADQRIASIDQDTSIFQAFDTTYNYIRSFDRSGGLLSFKIGTSYKVNKYIGFGCHDWLDGAYPI